MSIEAIKRARQIFKDYAEPESGIDSGNLYWALGVALQAIADQEKAEPVAWMPIETAPKDSTSILIYCPKNERKPVCEAWWAIAYEGDDGGHWQTPIGPNGRGYTILATAPTHWMPLPTFPLHTHPAREWVGLTDEEREMATGWSVEHIEAKLKEKNT